MSLELLPPKSKISSGSGPKYWVVWLEDKDVLIPEAVLKAYGLLQESPHGWYIDLRLKQFVKLIELEWYGSKRRGYYIARRIYNADGALLVEYDRESAEARKVRDKLNDFQALWELAVKVAVPPQLETKVEVKDDRAKVYIDNDTVTIEYRGRYTVINGPQAILNILVSNPDMQKLGFVRGTYGGLISKRPVSNIGEWIKSIAETVANILKNSTSVISAKYEAARKDIEIARERLGIRKPADQPITVDDIISLVLKQQPTTQQPAAPQVEEPEELEVEVVQQPQPQPPKPEIKLPEVELEVELPAPKAPKPVEETPRRKELVKIYLLAMRLPSKYLVQQVKIEPNERGYIEKRAFEDIRAEVASRLEGIRRSAQKMIERIFCYVEEFGVWIAVSDAAVEEARKVSEYVVKELNAIEALKQIKNNIEINSYMVKAIPVYLEPEHAKELLQAAIEKMSADVAELETKIKEAEQERKMQAMARLQKEYEYKFRLLEAFKQYLAQIS